MPKTDEARSREVIVNWLEEAKFFGQKDPHAVRRADPRYTWTRPMELMVDGTIHYVYTRDVSRDGVGLTCRERLDDESRVQLRRDSNDPWVPARVVHCTQTVGAFKIGIDLAFEV